jgi:hypothetical protein
VSHLRSTNQTLLDYPAAVHDQDIAEPGGTERLQVSPALDQAELFDGDGA